MLSKYSYAGLKQTLSSKYNKETFNYLLLLPFMNAINMKICYIPTISSFMNFKDTFGILLEFAFKRRILIVLLLAF